MNSYEACCVFRVEDDKFAVGRDTVRAALQTLGFEGLKEEDMQVKSLAYPIKKFYQGHYYLFDFQMDPAKAHEIEKEVRLIPELLRILVTRKDD